jgi:hypothetical protein
VSSLDEIPLRAVAWKPSYRLIASRYPTVGLYDAIADPADLEVVFAIEALTNPRIRNELGQLQLVPPDERLSGAGSTPIMAAFTHLNPEGSRFSDGSYGVYYAAQDLDTAVAEVSHHRALFLARTAEPPIDIDLRLITAALEARLHDLRAESGAQRRCSTRTTTAPARRWVGGCAKPAAGACSTPACAAESGARRRCSTRPTTAPARRWAGGCAKPAAGACSTPACAAAAGCVQGCSDRAR